MRVIDSAPACPRGSATPLALVRAGVSRIGDFVELTKPKIAVLALATVCVGYIVGAQGHWQVVPLAHALLGIALVAAASSALNQLLEVRVDARMQRTASRPLPAGRLSRREALAFGLLTGVTGIAYLAVFVNATTAALSLATLVLYVLVYTPLKPRTTLCTTIGAVPGALPPVLGWTAAGGSLDAGAFSLFAILFLWQFPHFLAIAWLYRRQYGEAGLRMLPARASVDDAQSDRTVGWLATGYALALIPVSLLPVLSANAASLAGDGYLAAAVVLGAGYLASAIGFLAAPARESARRLLYASLIYLPALLTALTWDHVSLLQ